MDIATVIGIASGFGLILITIVSGGAPDVFIHLPAAFIVVGGTIAATLINFPLRDVIGILGPVRNAFFHQEVDPTKLIAKLVEFATIARREGILALEGLADDSGDEFLEKSVQLAIDGTSPDLIKDILTTEVAFMEDRHENGQSILVAMGTFAPAFGMIGTLIGLVRMLSTMNDPSTIGEGMAIALLTTLYGAVLANMIFLPSAGKLRVRTSSEMLAREITIEGILAIQSGDNPRIVEQKLMAFVAPDQRGVSTVRQAR